jgi:hypothetical protein
VLVARRQSPREFADDVTGAVCAGAVFEAPIAGRVHEEPAGLIARPTLVDGMTGGELRCDLTLHLLTKAVQEVAAAGGKLGSQKFRHGRGIWLVATATARQAGPASLFSSIRAHGRREQSQAAATRCYRIV